MTLLIALSCHKSSGHDISTCHCDECLDIKIGQMIIAGFKGIEPSEEIRHAIKELHIGGVILFDHDVSNGSGERNIRTPEQLNRLTRELRALTDRPLMIAIDQEGGVVNRLKADYGFPATVSAAYQGATGSLDSASYWAAATAKTLVECGINVNFAPCTDVNVNTTNFINKRERTFSANPDSVYLFADRWVTELHKQGVISSLKHFPGHGSSQSDSHLGLADITTTWSESELIPYQRFATNGYNGIVMVGHLFNKNIDPDYPSSLSQKTLDGMLRKKVGFKGVIAADDMNMRAIVDHYSFDQALVLSINAGNNMIIIGNNATIYEPGLAARCHAIIKSKVKDGSISIQKIDDSYRRLTNLVAQFLGNIYSSVR